MTTKNMTKDFDPRKISQLLTLSSRQLDDGILSALSSARQNALARQKTARASAFALSTGSESHSTIPDSAQQWVVAALLVAILIVGTSFWHHIQEQQIDEVDVAILTDDLPIEVFVD